MKRFIAIFIIVLALGAGGYYAYNRIMAWHAEGIESAKSQVKEELGLHEVPAVPAEKLVEAFGAAAPDVSGEKEGSAREETERKIMAFFQYLDSRAYVSSYKLEGDTYQEFQKMIKELTAQPPLIAGETESLHTLYKNMAHLFGVLGIKRINLIKNVLKNEADIMEQVMNSFFLWFTMKSHPGSTIKGRPSLKTLYEYSGFFLHTLAGRGYLLRRDAKIRILTSYYCVLILDRANDSVLNSMGINIRPHIKSSVNDVRNHSGFVQKELYLLELEKLRKKYQL